MENQHNINILTLTLVFLFAVLLPLGEACGEPAVPLQIENRTDMVLAVYVQGIKAGEVEPNSSIEVKNLGATGYYLIEAKTSKAEVIYTRKFDFNELNDADWKVVIPPSGGNKNA